MLRVPPLRALTVTLLLCAGCRPGLPEGARENTAPTWQTHEPYFPIARGKHERVDCDACHGGFTTFRDFSCVTCHEHREANTSPAHAAVPDYTFGPKSCFTCHPRGTVDGAVDHARFFPIGEGTTHPDQSCAACHVVPGDRQQVSCIDCHAHAEAPMRMAHTAVTDFRWTTEGCLSCHPTGEALSREAHDPIFPISAATAHRDGACRDCHPNPTDLEAVACIGCHPHAPAPTAQAHRRVGGYAGTSPACLKCHDRSQVFPTSQHRPFRITPGSNHGPGEAACLECHPRTQPSRPFPAADFAIFDCTGCHSRGDTDGEHDDVRGYRYDSPTCVQSGCHPTGEESD